MAKTAKPHPKPRGPQHSREHLAARHNLLANLLFKKAIGFEGDTFWEEVTCVGFNPALRQLLAVVSVKQTSGYQGGLCLAGSSEYVRFFVDWGAGLTDVGLASFTAHDIPDVAPDPPHPIQYMVHLSLDDATHRKLCNSPVLPHVRAVLSWNAIPSLNPNAVPIFGNAIDAHIQIQPEVLILEKLMEAGVAQLPSWVLDQVDVQQTLAAGPLMPVPLHALLPENRRRKVPDHRTLYPVIQPLVAGGQSADKVAAQQDLAKLGELGIDLEELLEILFGTEEPPGGDTSFEEVVCAGLNTDTDTLGAVIRIKRPSGYGGNLCQGGSTEYVAFWADWDDSGSYATYLGTAAVQVHDIGAIPPDGLSYVVLLPSNFSAHLTACGNPNIARLRAVLSWSTPPSTVDPNALNFWGNRLDVAMQIRPGEASQGLIGYLYYVGGVSLMNISPTTFLALPSSGVLNPANCAQPAMDRPFAGATTVGGRISNFVPGTAYYQVQFSPHGAGSWLPVMSGAFTFTLSDPTNPPFFQTNVTYTSLDGWYLFEEDPAALKFEIYSELASWNTLAVADGPYDLRLAYTTDYPITAASVIHYTNTVTIIVSNRGFTTSPTPNTVIDTSFDVDLIIDGGDCHSYPQGGVLTGHLRATNPYFWTWTLDPEPSTHTHGTQCVPPCRSYGSLADQGATPSEAWSLNTTKLDRCGYTVTLRAYDRAIVNSNGAVVHSASKAVGFAVI
ncbi:hypothetical protein SAMN05444161_5636 [Rhizobiales bacterium GAS191]|nr:hypothetical protein SAMN05444161_5636 [Rhizobiales bacterium GAS191]